MATLGKFPHATTCSTLPSWATTARKKRVGPSFLLCYFLMIIIAKNGGYFTCHSLSASQCLSVSHSLFLSIFRSLGHIFRKFLFMNPISQITFPENFLILKIVISVFPFPTSLSALKSQFPREVWLSFPISCKPNVKLETNVNCEKKFTKNVPQRWTLQSREFSLDSQFPFLRSKFNALLSNSWFLISHLSFLISNFSFPISYFFLLISNFFFPTSYKKLKYERQNYSRAFYIQFDY